tara:strand:+ start:835 stop:1887 length:1053 start_codon:yes stop_codon:yes gene_type:complete
MAFLDNSGDIILDAVLTDAGRQRMARGNFKITKFAFGDEEINYGVFNSSHPSGSAFYDLEVMQTPILEAFTNNTSLMKSKLITMSRNNILFLPTLKLNDNADNGTKTDAGTFSGGYIVLAETNTERNGGAIDFPTLNAGILRGEGQDVSDLTDHIAIDQGIDSSEGGLSFKSALSDDMIETAFIIRCDHRLLQIHYVVDSTGQQGGKIGRTVSHTNQFVDDDGIASYYVALGDGTTFIEGKPGTPKRIDDNRVRRNLIGNPDVQTMVGIREVFEGPLGSILRLYPRTSMHVRQSSSLFDELGTTVTSGSDIKIKANEDVIIYKYIDTLINVVGVTTGYSIDIPIRIVRKT